MVFEEMQAFHLLRQFRGWHEIDNEKAKEAGDYIISLANKIKKARGIGPWIEDAKPIDVTSGGN